MENDIEKITSSIREKLGEEASSKIADDIANIITIEANRKKEIKDKDEEITRINKDKEVLIKANGNLLQQVSFGKDDDENDTGEEKKPFDFRSIFDANGKIKNRM